ncbi:MAG: AtpZ/AtpI family protein [Lachnospiraceae bacterium]|nr:AtpZ/AtpI family protein [Lachnospiraceae bacterium]
MKSLSNIIKQLSMISQLGITLIMPLLLCMLLCWFLTAKCDLGGWVFIPGLIFGLGGSFMSGYKIYKIETEKNKKKDNKVSFNKHY